MTPMTTALGPRLIKLYKLTFKTNGVIWALGFIQNVSDFHLQKMIMNRYGPPFTKGRAVNELALFLEARSC